MASYYLLLNLAAVLCMTFAHPAANDLKTKFAEDNEIPGPKFAAKGVSAEFGGYKASAGLGGGDAGGGLFAKAETPNGGVGAGLFGGAGAGGGGASAGAGFGGFEGGKQPGQGNGFFDRIFNIPISVLHSVNTYVKSKGDGSHGAGAAASASGSPGSTLTTQTRFAVSEEDGSVAGASASASAGGAGGVQKVRGKPDYDKIFNIPISALQSVNDFLNG